MAYADENMKKFVAQRMQARRRGIDFFLTFDEWMGIWAQSGLLSERGKGIGKYNMARFGDTGPYAVGNVFIMRHEENTREGSIGRTLSPASREKVAASKRGKKLSAKCIETLRVAKQGNRYRSGTQTSEVGLANIRAGQQRRRERERAGMK